MLYDNIDDARMRLSGSVIRFKGMPVYVLACEEGEDGEIFLSLEDCFTRETFSVKQTNPELDVSSPPLGYITFYRPEGYACGYATRVPARRQVQGVVLNRLQIFENGTRNLMRNIFITLEDVGKCILGKYDDAYEKYIRMLDNNVSAIIPFSREIACSPTKVYYRSHRIGDIRNEEGKHIINLTMPTMNRYSFEEVFNENWRINW